MNVFLLAALLVLGLISLAGIVRAFRTSEPGYEDRSGFHAGEEPSLFEPMMTTGSRVRVSCGSESDRPWPACEETSDVDELAIYF